MSGRGDHRPDEANPLLKRACVALENAALVAQKLADRADTKNECDSYKALAHANQTILARVAAPAKQIDGEPASYDLVIRDFDASRARIRALQMDESVRDRQAQMCEAERAALSGVRRAVSIDPAVRAQSLRELAGLVEVLDDPKRRSDLQGDHV